MSGLRFHGVALTAPPTVGHCCICGADAIAGTAICATCLAAVRAIVDPPLSCRRHVVEAVACETRPIVLALAAVNARGDWRRGLIARQQDQLRRAEIAAERQSLARHGIAQGGA